jgi:hypothetical protein
MKNSRTENKGYSQTSSNSRSGGIEALRPSTTVSQKPVESSQGTQATPLRPVLAQEEIAKRAKAIWEKRGRPYGDDQADWFEAETQLRREESQMPSRSGVRQP